MMGMHAPTIRASQLCPCTRIDLLERLVGVAIATAMEFACPRMVRLARPTMDVRLAFVSMASVAKMPVMAHASRAPKPRPELGREFVGPFSISRIPLTNVRMVFAMGLASAPTLV